MFQQDGQLNENNNNNNNTELSIDTVDIAPFRYRNDIAKPVLPLLNSSSTVYTSVTSDKNGKFESSSVTICRPPITIIKKGAALSPKSSGDHQNEYQAIKPTNKSIPEETSRSDSLTTEVKKASFTNSNRNGLSTPNEITQTKVIYAQSSSKTLGQILPNDYDVLNYSSVTSNSNIINILTPKSTETVTSSSNDYSDFEESSGNYINNANSISNMDSNENYSNDSNNYTQVYSTNIIGAIDRSQTMPSKKLIPNY
jgi:hypothetical protein